MKLRLRVVGTAPILDRIGACGIFRAAIHLPIEDIERIEKVGAQIAGTRYDLAQMRTLDSEK